MRTKQKILGIILAKSKSRRVKNKNFRKVKGKYLFQYILDEAIKTSSFQKIHISTESEKVLKKIKNLKKKNTKYKKYIDLSFLRPKYMTDDKFPMEKVVDYIREKFEDNKFEHFAMLYATAVNLKHNDLKKFINFYLRLCKKYSNSGITCRTLTAYPAPVEWSMSLTNKSEIKYDNINAHKRTSDTFRKKFFDSGGIQIFNKKYFLTNRSKTFGYVMPYYKCIDIDFEDDFILAKKLI